MKQFNNNKYMNILKSLIRGFILMRGERNGIIKSFYKSILMISGKPVPINPKYWRIIPVLIFIALLMPIALSSTTISPQEYGYKHIVKEAPDNINNEVIWLARVIYSETKVKEEQILVAWVVRNRVETNYRGSTSYKDVILDPFQFSAFNKGSIKRSYFTGLTQGSTPMGWKSSIDIAYHVMYCPELYRPIPLDTRHFYSERSMISDSAPKWAASGSETDIDYVDENRFKFYNGVL